MKYYIEYNEKRLTNLIESTDQYKADLLIDKDDPRMVIFLKRAINENEKFLKNVVIEKE